MYVLWCMTPAVDEGGEGEKKEGKEEKEETRRRRGCTYFSVRCQLVMRRRINTEAVDGFMIGHITWVGLCCCMALCGNTGKGKGM